jgi:drug/metabolite transporter (DMT)-like permease
VTGIPLPVAAMVLGSALLHATWNVLLRSGADRLWSITVMSLVSGLAAVAAIGVLPAPAMASWAYAAGSGVLQVGYCLFLVWAYEKGELGQVFPIARGAAPLLVALGAAVFAGERLSPWAAWPWSRRGSSGSAWAARGSICTPPSWR